MRVLIADDCQTTTSMLEEHLRCWGYEPMTVNDGAQALRVLRSAAGPKLALLDWSMPELDGTEVCKLLRERHEQSDDYTYVVMLTSKEGGLAVEALEAGVDDYLTKPVPSRELQLRLRVGKRIVEMHQRVVASKRQLATMTTIDPSTSALTRDGLMTRLSQEVDRAKRNQTELSLLHAKIDQLDLTQRVGDGGLEHLVLMLASRLRRSVRSYDLIAKTSKQSFLVALPDANADFAAQIAERVRHSAILEPFDLEEGRIDITLSFGIACTSDVGYDRRRLVEEAGAGSVNGENQTFLRLGGKSIEVTEATLISPESVQALAP